MRADLNNPFQITKAVDFSDKEIDEYWVDFPSEGGFYSLAKPSSSMPMLILGGKGSGKTHLMRYFSFNLQKLRHSKNIIRGIQDDGYLGVFLRCRGLNAARFSGKGQSVEKWKSLFAYYMDLSLTEILLRTIEEIHEKHSGFSEKEAEICKEIVGIFDVYDWATPKTISSLLKQITEIRKELDYSINNCPITGELDVKILSSPGRLLFETPQVLIDKLEHFDKIVFLYLIDEFESLNEGNQRYINTLVREKEPPCSFKIGARLYGIKTLLTYSADEEIKEGSEYEKLNLDSQFRQKSLGKEYKKFVANLCLKRIHGPISTTANEEGPEALVRALNRFFESEDQDEFLIELAGKIKKKYINSDRPYIKKLKEKMKDGLKAGCAFGVRSEDDILEIINSITMSSRPDLEKLNIFLLYQDWYSKKNLMESSNKISSMCEEYSKDPSAQGRYSKAYKHRHKDLLAQLLRETDGRNQYYGVEELIKMSHGLPRNLLVTLKFIYKWSIFNGEKPLRGEKMISKKSQNQGVREAAEWFFNDAQPIGGDGKNVRDSISRLATLFREIRFSDKPAEVSLITFSVDISKVTEKARNIIELAEKWSLIVRVPGGQKGKRLKRVDPKYQLNCTAAPRWDLSVARRGTLALNPDEVSSIFDPDCSDEFDALLKERIDRMTAPSFGKKKVENEKKKIENNSQKGLPGF